MSYLLTAATDVKDLMAKIRDFASTDGWTVGYDAVAASGRVGLSKGVCFISMQATTTTVTDAATGAVLNESYIQMGLADAFAGGVTTYYGHTNSIVTGLNDADGCLTRDLYGPFTNVWLFSNAAKTEVHCVAQTSDRYSFISFGILEDHGLTQPDVAFIAGHDYMWWNNAAGNFTVNGRAFNDPAAGSHHIGYFANGNNLLRIPSGLVDPALGFAAGTFYVSAQQNNASAGILHATHTRMRTADDIPANGGSLALDFLLAAQDDVTIGGSTLAGLPMYYYDTDAPGLTYLGDIPDVRSVYFQNLAAAQEITYAGDTWLCFPMKQKGTFEDSNYGSNYTARCNSIYYGFAFKKTV